MAWLTAALVCVAPIVGIAAAAQPLVAQSQDDMARFDRATTAYYKRGNFAQAKAILDTIITRDSTLRVQGDTNGVGLNNYGNPYVMRSQARRRLGDIRGAERDLDMALALTPGLGSRDMVLGLLRQADNDVKGALRSFTRAVSADSLDARAWFARGQLRLFTRDSAGGYADLRRAAQLGDTMAQSRTRPRLARSVTELAAMNRRADSLERFGDVIGALAIYDSLARLSNWSMAFVSRARIRLRLGDSEGALKDLDSALTLEPLLAQGVLARSSLRLARGDTNGAKEDLKTAMRFNFNSPVSSRDFFDRGMLRIGLGDQGGMDDVRAAAGMGWVNAERVLKGLRPVPMESLNVIMAAERDSAQEALRAAARSRPPPVASKRWGTTSVPWRDAQLLLIALAPWIAGLVAFAFLFVGVFALWLRLTPEGSVSGFDTQAGERQLWIGAPAQGLMLPRRAYRDAIALLLFVVVAGGFLYTAFQDGLWVLAIPGVPFLLVAVYQLFGRHFVDARNRKITVYALTNQRAIVSVGDEVQTYPIDSLRSATLVEHGGGTGSITWGSVEGDLQREMERALAEGRSVSIDNVRAAVKSGRRALWRFDRIYSAKSVFAKIQSAGPATAAAPAVSVASDAPEPAQKRGELVQTERSSPSSGQSAAVVFGIFTVIGLVTTYFFSYRYVVSEYVASRDWVAVPCKIVSSRMDSREETSSPIGGGADQTVTIYSVDVTFWYKYNGKGYIGTRYQLKPVSLGGFGAQDVVQARVAALPPRLMTTCWLDPKNPENAVLDRSMTLGTWFAVVPPIVALLGLLGLASLVRKANGTVWRVVGTRRKG